MLRTFLLLGAVNAFLAVACGAFGAHGLQTRVTPDMIAIWKTGAEYQMYHALALLAVAVVGDRIPTAAQVYARRAGWLFTAGIVFFAGSLYILALTGVKILGAITPIGGACFLSGWVALMIAAYHIPAKAKLVEEINR